MGVGVGDFMVSVLIAQITGVPIIYSIVFFFQVQIKENIKAPRHCPVWGESPGDQWIPLTKGQ